MRNITREDTRPQPITCHCSVCPETNKCNLTLHFKSQCYKSVFKNYNATGAYHFIETEYGCLSGQDGHLSARQCNVNLSKSEQPFLVGCCRDKDYCNEYLPGPDLNDHRWRGAKFDVELESQQLDTMLIIAVATIFIFSTLILIFGAVRAMMHFKSISSRRSVSSSSTCTSKADLEKSISQFQNSQYNNPSSSDYSAHTYQSTSDDPCKKPDPYDDDDGSFKANLTSGIGQNLLKAQTMAGTINSSKKAHVGSGRFGVVFRAIYHGEPVAVKAFNGLDVESWKREESILKRLNHENIVRFIGTETVPGGNIWLYLEFCHEGSLCDFLDRNIITSPWQTVSILFSIINGLNHLHEDFANGYKPPIAHRDIKSKNILMRNSETCCIADFGHSLTKVGPRKLDFGNQPTLHVGTVRYMAPEILRHNSSLDYQEFSTFAKADLYQYSLVIWEVLQRTSFNALTATEEHLLPYDGSVAPNPCIDEMAKLVCDEEYRPKVMPHWKHGPLKEIVELMKENWRPNPKARLETLATKNKIKEIYNYLKSKYQKDTNYWPNISFNTPELNQMKNSHKRSDITM